MATGGDWFIGQYELLRFLVRLAATVALAAVIAQPLMEGLVAAQVRTDRA
jgi:hypothetical protein